MYKRLSENIRCTVQLLSMYPYLFWKNMENCTSSVTRTIITSNHPIPMYFHHAIFCDVLEGVIFYVIST